MGQGTDSCGGYEVDYEPYADGLETGMWTQHDSSLIKVTDMSLRHLKNARRLAQNMAACATFTSDSEMWEEWVECFDRAIDGKPEPIKQKRVATPKAVVRGASVRLKCNCGTEYPARLADLKRGWGKCCGKRCAAIKREYGRPDAVCAVTGQSIAMLIKTRRPQPQGLTDALCPVPAPTHPAPR